jgi:hypothetical protein
VALLFFILCFFLTKPVFAETSIKISGYSAASPEFVKLKNNSTETVDITGWYFKDLANNKKTISYTSILGNAEIQIDYVDSWINDDGDTIYLYDSTNTLVDSIIYIVPTKTPTPTKVPTPTPTLSPTSTPDPTVTNPSSGISFTEFMPYSDPEWIELYNSNDKPVKLIGWKLEDKDGHTRNVGENGVISIGANSYFVFEYSAFFDNNNIETVILRRQDNSIVAQTSYSAGLRTVERSWSLINNSWCQSSITKGYGNVTSCYTAPTSTPIQTPTPTPDQGKFTSSDTATESAIIEPSTETSYLSPSIEPTTSPTGTVLGNDVTNTTKKNYLPLILIISGGLLLTSPIIISKLKK